MLTDPNKVIIQDVKMLKFRVATAMLTLAALASARVQAQDVIAVANGVNMWDGQWHYDVTAYLWVPWLYTSVDLPPIAGGGSETITTAPHQYLKYLEGGVMADATVRKGDFSLWTDFVFFNLQASPTHTREVGLPGGDPLLVVNRTIDSSVRMAIWTLAPGYTVMNNDIGTLDVIAGLRYTSIRVSIAYEFTAPPTALAKGGGFWPTTDSTDGLIGIKGAFRLSKDGKWTLPYEADVADGNKNWQNNEFLGVAYGFRWGDVGAGVRNLTYQSSDRPIVQKLRFTGPVIGASFRW
jgi:hypothetical protein